MLKIRPSLTSVITSMALLSLLGALFPFTAAAQSNSKKYIFLLASGFVCDPGDSSACPVLVKSSQGDTYEISGAGAFDTGNRSVNAAGTYTHRSPNGKALETGVWLASELVNFNSYGAAPTALQRQNLAFEPQLPSLKRLPMPTSPKPTGGLAVLRVRLLPLRGPSRTAVLEVNCALGNVPRERSVEGIRLSFEGNANDFSEEIGGRVLFLATPSETGAHIEALQRETAPETSVPEHK